MRHFLFLALILSAVGYGATDKFAVLETQFTNEARPISLDAVRKPASVPSSYAGLRSGYCVDKFEVAVPWAFISEVKGKRVVWFMHSLKGYAKPEMERLPADYVNNLKRSVYGEKSANRKLFTLPAETANGLSFFKTVPLKNSKMVGDPAAFQFFVKEAPSVFQGSKPDILMKITCEKTDGCEEGGEMVPKGSVTHYCRFAGSRLQPW